MIILDAATTSTDQTASPITWNHTVGAACSNNGFLVVAIGLVAATTQPSVSAVTYNGVAMTKARGDQDVLPIGDQETSIWFLANPTTGTNQVSVAFSGGITPHGGGVSVSYYAAAQTSTADASNGTTGTTTGDQTLTVATGANNCWVVTVGINTAASAPTMVSDQTQRGTLTLGFTTATVLTVADTNNPVGNSTATTVGYTVGGSVEKGFTISAASFAPAGLGIQTKLLRPAPFRPGLAR